MPRAPFQRLVREVAEAVCEEKPELRGSLRFKQSALEALQEATEAFVVRRRAGGRGGGKPGGEGKGV